MRNVQKIIDTKGGLAALKSRPIRLEVPGFMRLVIEYIGRGPRGCDMVSVAHYGEQNGDAMRDPEIMFEVVPDAKGGLTWHPVAIQQDYIGSYQQCVFEDEQGRVMIRPALVRDIAAFARIWDRNLKHQGFVDAAQARAGRCDNDTVRGRAHSFGVDYARASASQATSVTVSRGRSVNASDN
jgi:hypothetical protein